MKFISLYFVLLFSLSVSAQTNNIDSTSIIVNDFLTEKIAPPISVIVDGGKTEFVASIHSGVAYFLNEDLIDGHTYSYKVPHCLLDVLHFCLKTG